MLTFRGPVVQVSVPLPGLDVIARLTVPAKPDGRMLPPASATATTGWSGKVTPATPTSGRW